MTRDLLSPFLLIFSFISLFAQTPCANGNVDIPGGGNSNDYPCLGLTLQSYVDIEDMGDVNTGEAQDSWGWTDSQDGDEYALVALDNGTAFINITNPVNPVYLGWLPSVTGTSFWRDLKVYQNHAYIVTDANGDHGMQIFDLTKLRTAAPGTTFTRDGRVTWGTNSGNRGIAHNIAINEDSGYAYVMGVSPYINGGIVIFNLNPVNGGSLTNPPNVAEISGDYCHDAQIITYDGPDPDYQGDELLIGSFSGSNNVKILNVTDKNNVSQISSIDYTNKVYTHQGWFTEDKRFFLVGDELDEVNAGIGNTRTVVYDFEDLDNPSLHYIHSGTTPAIDHNGYVSQNRFYLANYTAGARVFKVDGLYEQTPTLDEVNFMDTYPANNIAGFNGTWNIYPFFESGNLVVTGFGEINDLTDGGLFIMRDPNFDNTDPTVACQNITATLDPSTGTVTVLGSDINNGTADTLQDGSNNTNFTLSISNGPTTFTCADVGQTFNVTLTAVDDYGNSNSCSSTITVAAETTQFIGGDWNNGAPGPGSNARISQNTNTSPTNAGSIESCVCEIDSGARLTISSNEFIKIERDITVNGTLRVQHRGSVLQTDGNAITNNAGTIEIETTSPNLDSKDFMILGSPMSGDIRTGVWNAAYLVLDHTTENFVPNAQVALLQPGAENFADDNFDNWDAYIDGITPGEGYIVRPQSGNSQPGGIFNYTYTGGTLNNGLINFPIIYNTPGPLASDNRNASPNILSNPYPSAISATDFINANAMINEVYFWEHNTPPSSSIPGFDVINFSMDDISLRNLTGGNSAPSGGPEPTDFISTSQGFGVKATAVGTAIFNNSMRRTTGNTTLRNPEEPQDRIWLEVKQEKYNLGSSTLIAFSENTINGIDPGYDSPRLASSVSIYSHLGDGSEQLGIQSLAAYENRATVLLGFSSSISEETVFTISIKNREGRLEGVTVHLIDNVLRTMQDITNKDYSFKTKTGIQNSRFRLQFIDNTRLGNIESKDQSIIVFPNPADNFINIYSRVSYLTNIEVFDLSGRRIYSPVEEKVKSFALNINELNTGIYFAIISTEDGSVTKKFIKK
ncbi:choice-of-anchor B family protein [Patiriisocius sp. Uisw_017]|jgi:choice-of-anchor B domain-containing protein|uniref:choice-of-anchor B family protein n=1 Tax=Patiriisocius sp. Uisw_017 TaxID=3230968 RepID=UPI0039E95652